MTTKPKSFHVTEYIEDECAARGWSLDDLAIRMVDLGKGMTEEEWVKAAQVDQLALEMMASLRNDPIAADMRLGGLAAGLARAFGTSVELWTNLEASWLAAHPKET